MVGAKGSAVTWFEKERYTLSMRPRTPFVASKFVTSSRNSAVQVNK